jgi:hypothetical protein
MQHYTRSFPGWVKTLVLEDLPRRQRGAYGAGVLPGCQCCSGPQNLHPLKEPPTEAVFLRLRGGDLRFLAAASFQKCGDSGDKLQEFRIHAGLQPFKVRVQNGDKAGTVRGQYQYVKKITHTYTFSPFNRSFLPHALPCVVPFALAVAGGLIDSRPGCACLVPTTARPRPAIDRPGKGREKGFPMAPPLAALCMAGPVPLK